jgi:enoyl-CoA hydratase
MSYECIATDRVAKVGILTFNRERVLNAFNTELIEETNAAMAGFIDDDDIAAIVVHGAGRAFSAGFDLKESAQRKIDGQESAQRKIDGPGEWAALLRTDFDFIMQFWDCPKPTVAAAHGHCLAGAFELALACDVTVAAESTLFGEPEVRFSSGIIAMLLPWVTGPKQAKELLLSGNDRIPAQRAYDFGLINRVVPDGEEFDTALSIARDMSRCATHSVRMTKLALHRTYEIMGMRQALHAALDIDTLIESTMTPEKLEFKRIREERGLKAALAWRDAKFTDGDR